MTPHKLATTVAVGTVVGIIPTFGLATILGTAIAARFRLNVAATILIVYLVQPLQLIFFLPFIKAGIYVFGLSELKLSLDEITMLFKTDWLEALQMLWIADLVGILVWVFVAVPVGFGLYFVMLPVLRRVLPKPIEVA